MSTACKGPRRAAAPISRPVSLPGEPTILRSRSPGAAPRPGTRRRVLLDLSAHHPLREVSGCHMSRPAARARGRSLSRAPAQVRDLVTQRALFSELHRALRPNARLVITEHPRDPLSVPSSCGQAAWSSSYWCSTATPGSPRPGAWSRSPAQPLAGRQHNMMLNSLRCGVPPLAAA